MIGLDTNILVRYIVRDDPRQAARADALLEGLTRDSPGFGPLLVLAELYWTLTRSYRFTPVQSVEVVSRLLAAGELRVQDRDVVRRAVERAAVGAARTR